MRDEGGKDKKRGGDCGVVAKARRGRGSTCAFAKSHEASPQGNNKYQ